MKTQKSKPESRGEKPPVANLLEVLEMDSKGDLYELQKYENEVPECHRGV